MEYDTRNPKEIESYGKHLIGKSLSTARGVREVPISELSKPVSGRTRGALGTAVERYYFGIQPENDGTPDFKDAGVELKTSPVKRSGKNYVAKERLVLGLINYLEERNKKFTESSYFTKNERLMLISYLHDENKSIGEVRFLLAKLYEFNDLPKEDQKIIREDWEKINTKIRAGLAHELSEGDTLYLGACTKSASSKNRRDQFNGIQAKPRAYSYKTSYMNLLLRRELGSAENIERLLSDSDADKAETFEQQVIARFSPYIGKTDSAIAEELGITATLRQKDRFAILARAMMGVKGKRIEEFEAAGITMKTIQLDGKGRPKEAMSFPMFRFTDIVNETWDGDEEEGEERSSFQKQIESRFLFVVYQCSDKCKEHEPRTLKKAFFWNMSAENLEEARRVWERTKDLIRKGEVVKSIKMDSSGKTLRETYLPASSQSPVVHVRPHGKNAEDTIELPVADKVTGMDKYTKQCFWLNKDYLFDIVNQTSSVSILKNKSYSVDEITSPYSQHFKEIPLYDSIGCGELMHAETSSDETVRVPAWLIKPGAKYFALRTRGDSMNQLGITDGDTILCQKNYQAPDGSNAVVLIGDDATLKKIKYEKDGLVLIPRSSNPEHKIRKLTEEDEEFKVLGVFVCKLEKPLE